MIQPSRRDRAVGLFMLVGTAKTARTVPELDPAGDDRWKLRVNYLTGFSRIRMSSV
jgi:hypothetical protein